MYLKKLELHGFKSFALRTVLEFDPGITAIVGPNGCGKSNIVDAVRWVIGEQRARILRSEKMENVIFNGTASRRPVGMSEVQLTIENNRGVLPTEYNEVMIGRRLYRSGDSEYLLNNVQCRLKDIVELFMDTGMGADAYSVIELKMVDQILSESAEDRRRMFEEAAGITKYKQRRRQALRKLETTQSDLTRVRDITAELDTRVARLKRQAAKAERAKDLEVRLHTLELSLAQHEFDRLSQLESTYRTEMETLHGEVDAYTARLANEEAQKENRRTTLVGQEQEVSKHQQRLSEHIDQVRTLESKLDLTEERLSTARREAERTRLEYEEAKERRTRLLDDKARHERTIGEQEPVVEKAEAQLQQAEEERDARRTEASEARSALQALQQEVVRVVKERDEKLREQDRLTNRLELLESDRSRTQQALDTVRKTTEQHGQRRQSLEQAQAEAREATEAAVLKLQEAESRREALQAELERAREALRKAERARDAAAAEASLLESLVASYEAFSDAVQFLAEEKEWTSRDLATVADVLACDESDRAALNAALGAYGSCIVVEDEEEVRRAAALLHREKRGQATFIVLTRLQNPGSDGTAVADSMPLREAVRTIDSAYETLADVLLRDCYLVDSLEEAQRLHQHLDGEARLVTRTGEWLDARGTIHVGSQDGDGSPVAGRIGRREQLDTTRAELERLDERLTQRTAAVEELQEKLDALPLHQRREDVETARQALRRAESDSERAALEARSAQEREEEYRTRLATLEEDMQSARAQLEGLVEPAEALDERLEQLRAERERAEKAVRQAERISQDAQDRYGRASLQAVEARNQLSATRTEWDRAVHEIEQTERLIARREQHLKTLQDTIDTSESEQASLTQQLAEIRNERAGLDEAVSTAKTALMETRVAIDKLDTRLRQLRSAREERLRAENERSVRLAEVRTKREDLLESIQEDYGRDLRDAPFEIDESLDLEEARKEVRTLRAQYKRLGSINALALDEYEEERERLEFLTTQRDDLEEAEQTLMTTIEEINRTAAERFASTFDNIQENFRKLFAELFGDEASADLELADPDDPLESAIEIIAKPRGKRPVGIAQLSSGEKALTAVALLFAIYLEKPSPFCLLDEVDAPLDDANVSRFMKLIRRFSEDTQFILVTHNKQTMELADRLYGITMQEHGVSQLVGVRFDEALEMAE